MNNQNDTTFTRLAHLETQVGALATQFKDFIVESKESRERSERELTKLWEAVVKQGEDLRKGIEQVGTKGQITWHMIFAAVSVIVGVVGFSAGILSSIVEGKIDRLHDKTTDIRATSFGLFDRAEHSSLIRHQDQETDIKVINARLNLFDQHMIQDSYNQGRVDKALNLEKP